MSTFVRSAGGTGRTFGCVFGRLAIGVLVRVFAVFQMQAQRAVLDGETR